MGERENDSLVWGLFEKKNRQNARWGQIVGCGGHGEWKRSSPDVKQTRHQNVRRKKELGVLVLNSKTHPKKKTMIAKHEKNKSNPACGELTS